MSMFISIPKWSDFNFKPTILALVFVLFQSQNGLILTYRKRSLSPCRCEFQSQNGLILTHVLDRPVINLDYISIPKWSDFNSLTLMKKKWEYNISIPKWSDFNFGRFRQKMCDLLISIPKWSDFNYANFTIGNNLTPFQSQNGLILIRPLTLNMVL